MQFPARSRTVLISRTRVLSMLLLFTEETRTRNIQINFPSFPCGNFVRPTFFSLSAITRTTPIAANFDTFSEAANNGPDPPLVFVQDWLNHLNYVIIKLTTFDNEVTYANVALSIMARIWYLMLGFINRSGRLSFSECESKQILNLVERDWPVMDKNTNLVLFCSKYFFLQMRLILKLQMFGISLFEVSN